jgi:hypothetical protein
VPTPIFKKMGYLEKIEAAMDVVPARDHER